MDAYAVLGLPRGSSKEQIKARYRELARRWHPDRNKEPGAEQKFKAINQAYELLINSNSTWQYAGAQYGTHSNARQNPGDPFGFASSQEWEDLIKKNFHDAWKNTQEEFKKYQYTPPPPKKCPHCNGTGWIPA